MGRSSRSPSWSCPGTSRTLVRRTAWPWVGRTSRISPASPTTTSRPAASKLGPRLPDRNMLISRRQFGLSCFGAAAGLLPLHSVFAAAPLGLPDPEPYAQLWNSSCEIAAAVLGLRMLGQPATEADLIVRLPMDE